MTTVRVEVQVLPAQVTKGRLADDDPTSAILRRARAVGFRPEEILGAMRDKSTQDAAELAAKQAEWLERRPSKAELETGLTAVEKGIHDIEANPLYALVKGDALDTLKKMRADLQDRIDEGEKSPNQTGPELA